MPEMPLKKKQRFRESRKERHEFADKDPEQIANELLSKRDPSYQEVADITIQERIPFSQYLPTAAAELNKHYDN